LVIGAHREELAFGEAVAKRLNRQRIDLLRIPVGLSGQRPGPGGLARYRQRHAELYQQIMEHVQPGQRVLIDLHTGFDERLCWADILCAEPALLRCIEQESAELPAPNGAFVRGVQLVADDGSGVPSRDGRQAPESRPCVKPALPESVWNAKHLIYVGIEVYLAQPSYGTPAEAGFAAAVVETVGESALSVRRVTEPS